jgi:hypothetical protein
MVRVQSLRRGTENEAMELVNEARRNGHEGAVICAVLDCDVVIIYGAAPMPRRSPDESGEAPGERARASPFTRMYPR